MHLEVRLLMHNNSKPDRRSIDHLTLPGELAPALIRRNKGACGRAGL
jgi:hypothetical protein